ncbi:MAG: tyrosine-type recombinase/integrase [Candidatus Zixiibacteriota bacterium]
MGNLRKKAEKGHNSRLKPLVEQAIKEVPDFARVYKKFCHKLTIGSYSKSTVSNYTRPVARMSLHFGKTPLDIDDDQVNEYLYEQTLSDTPSKSYFKHAVFGLRFLFRIFGQEGRAISLPSVKHDKKLPVVLSQEEMRRLLFAPNRIKQRVMFALIYSAGLRISELINLHIADIDSDRMKIHIRKGKGEKDRYVTLSHFALKGLRKYYDATRPEVYLFNGVKKGTQLSRTAIRDSFQRSVKKAAILKEVCVHTLRHSYATHSIEAGMDIVTLSEQMGHANIKSTLVYLHVAQIPKSNIFSPLDLLYPKA